MKTNFKKPLFPVDYASHIQIQDGEFYEDNSVLDYGNILNENNPITEEMAKDYAKLFCVSPYLLEALIYMLENAPKWDKNGEEFDTEIAIKAIQMLDAGFPF